MTALTVIPQQPVFSMSDIEKVAGAIAKGGLFGSKDPYAVLTLCLLAQAEGQHPAVVFRDYHIISGKPAKKADAMLRDFITGGGKVEWHTLDDDCADATFSHPSGGTVRISWDKARVAQAQLGGNAMHKKYPRQMLRARVISEGVRTVYPGATSGLYVPEEAAAFDSPAQPAHEHVEYEIENVPATKPEWPEGPCTGIMKLKTAVREFKESGNAALDLNEFEIHVATYAPHCEQLSKLVPPHSWWTGDAGDGNTFESLPEWIKRRREELALPDGMYAGLLASLKGCATSKALASWMGSEDTQEMIEALTDADRRGFELALALHESSILQEAMVRA